jgi:hypothetical protein
MLFALPLPVETTIMARLQDPLVKSVRSRDFPKHFFSPNCHQARRKLCRPDEENFLCLVISSAEANPKKV